MRIKYYNNFLFIFFAILCIVTNSHASNTKIDSLSKLIHAGEQDSNQIKIHIALAQEYIDINVDSAKYFAKKAVEPSEKLNYIQGIIKSNNLLGNCAQRKGDLDSAMAYYDVVEKIASENKDNKGMAIVLSNKGIIHINKGEYVKALEIILEAIDYEILVGDKKGMAQGYLNVGVVHYYMGDMDNTLKYFKKSAEITKEIGDLKVLKKAYINIGAIHQHKKELNEALDYYRKGHEIAVEVNDQTDITITLHNMAQVYVKMGSLDKAEELYYKSLEFEEKFENQRGIAIDYINLGELYAERKDFKKSEEFYEKAIKITRNKGYIKELESAFGGISEMYAENKQFEKAFLNSVRFVELKDSLVNEENQKNFAELRTKYETVEKEKALAEEQVKTEVLSKEKAKAELKAANRTKWVLILLALVIGSGLVFMLIVQRNKRRAQAEKDAALIAERDRGTKAVFTAQENERKRISKDLHDGVGQQLSGLKMAFQKLGFDIKQIAPNKTEEVEKLSSILSESADEVRAISHQMMPKALTELGLIEAIEDMLKKSLGIAKIKFAFEHFGITDRLSEQIEISLYRVAQELINNIIKHAKATEVSVQLFKNGDKLILVIEDNGTGIKNSVGDGHGLLNIRSRINTLHGEVNLEPSPNSGTLATIRIPIS